MHYRALRLAASAALVFLVSTASAQESLDALAEELVSLRGEVESLNAELSGLQQQHRAEMNSLASQKGDLEATRRREELRIRQLEQDLADNRQRAEQAGVAGEALIPVADEIMAALQRHIENGFPFRAEDRLRALADIRAQLESGALQPPQVINRLWRFYEDELRLTRDNGLYSQVIALGGSSVLADIAKLGAVALYFQTRDGRSGMVERSGDTWRYRLAEARADRDRIENLFDSLRKQIRTGYFELPNGSIRLESDS